jgi:ERCC4-type nuclease
MIVKVDVRESDLLQQMNLLKTNIPIFKDINIQSEVLPIGDIIINDDKSNEKLIIERKSVSDLLASIKDGRYEEQSFRLNGSAYHNHNIIYLIEGDINHFNRFKTDNKTEKLTLYSAMFSLNYYKGFSVFRSFSLAETATIICNMAYKLEKEKETKHPFYQNHDLINKEDIVQKTEDTSNQEEDQSIQEEEQQTTKDYVSVIKKVKKDNITPDNIGEIMLCQIPGISSVTALTIMNKFKSLPNLIKELENNQDCLKDISSINAKGQSRKINKTSILNIVKFLLKK